MTIFEKIKFNIKRIFLLNKRLLKKKSFVILLCLIPLSVLGLSLVAKDSGGMLSIVIFRQDKNDAIATEITQKLLDENNIILFEEVEDLQDGYGKVESGQAHALWIFNDNMQQKIDSMAKGNYSVPLVNIIEKEEDVSLQLSHEKLSGVIYPYLSYSIYENFMYVNIFKTDEITKEELAKGYENALYGGDLVLFQTISGKESNTDESYLTLPLRGLLALVVVLCGLSAVMYCQADRENHTYDWLARKKHIYLDFATCISAVFDSTLFVIIALVISKLSIGINELLYASVFILATTAFCMLIGVLTRKSSITGKLIPFIMILLLVLSPIFFGMSNLRSVQLLLPTYYYLYSIHNSVYCLYMLGYSILLFSITFVLNKSFNKD